MELFLLALALVLLLLLLVQVGLMAFTWGPMLRHTRRMYEQFTPAQRRRALTVTALGFAVSAAFAAGFLAENRAVIVGTAVFFAIYGLLMTPLAIWLDRRSRSETQ